MPLRYDPSRTTMLRRQYVKDMRRRFRRVRQANKTLIKDLDVMGLQPSKPFKIFNSVKNVSPKEWRFRTDTQKLKAYKLWLQQRIDADILQVAGTGKPWNATYIESAYKKGATRAYVDTHPEALSPSEPFYLGGQRQFLLSSFAAPETLSKIELLYTRAFDELKGVTDAMSQQMGRILAEGLAHGHSPSQIAREMSKSINKITRTRAEVIARTEVIRAHAEGQLDSLEALGITEVVPLVEWSTAGDLKVCAECDAMSGHVFTIDEARGLIPLHPNCRCAWIPAGSRRIRRKRK